MKKIILQSAVFFALLGGVASCQNENFDDKFDQSATERAEQRKKELSDELLSATDGWKLTYFTDNTQLGGFTYLFNFQDELNVEMISDVNPFTGYSWSTNPLQSRVSQYIVTSGSSTISLLFSEGSYIHLICNNAIYPNSALIGKGFKGDFQYLYYGKDSEGINFKTNRDGIDIKFERATAEDWTNLAANRTMMTQVTSKRTLTVVDNGVSSTYNFRYNAATRYASVLGAGNTSVNQNGGIGVGFSSNGIIISPAIEFEDGTTLSKLDFTGSQFIGSNGANTVTIL